MATETSATDELDKKEKEEGIGEKSVSLNEEKHDKFEDAQGPTVPLAKTEGEAGKDRKVEVEKTNDSLATATGASGEDMEADAALAKKEKTDDSPSLEASVAGNLKDENELISESPAISLTQTASDAPETQSQEPLPTVGTGEQNQPQTPDSSVEINPHIESEAEPVKETQPLEVQGKSREPKKESQQKGNEEQPNINATPKSSVETIEKTTKEPEFDAIAEAVKATANSEAGPTETQENPCATEKQSGEEEQLKTVIPETSAESTEKSGDMVEVQPPEESDIERLEAVPVSMDGEKKPIENLKVAEEVKEQSEDVETKQQLVGESTKSEGTSDDIKDPTLISLISKEEEETSVTAQVSLDKKAQVANEAEPGIAQNFVEEDGKKEPSCTDVIEGMSKGSVDVLENHERVFANQEAKTDLKEEKEDSPAPSVEEKVAANDDRKERDAHDVIEGLSREADTAITEEEQAKLESVKDDQPADDNEKGEHAETKVDEITTAVSERVRETLASKLEEKEGESITTGADKLEKETAEEPLKTVQIPDPPTKETPAKPPQKQLNNILSKVKQSLVKAKKAITGKSPTTKTVSSETKADIQVK